MKILKFYSETCSPCRMMTPILNKVAMDLDIEVDEIDTEEDLVLVNEYQITSVPVFILLEDGKQIGRIDGALPLAMFESRVKNAYGLL